MLRSGVRVGVWSKIRSRVSGLELGLGSSLMSLVRVDVGFSGLSWILGLKSGVGSWGWGRVTT